MFVRANGRMNEKKNVRTDGCGDRNTMDELVFGIENVMRSEGLFQGCFKFVLSKLAE